MIDIYDLAMRLSKLGRYWNEEQFSQPLQYLPDVSPSAFLVLPLLEVGTLPVRQSRHVHYFRVARDPPAIRASGTKFPESDFGALAITALNQELKLASGSRIRLVH